MKWGHISMTEKDKNPPMVRILPMDRKFEFKNWSIEKVQRNFFLQDLPNKEANGRKGRYLYKEKGMVADKGSVVLFQYDNMIIASAILTYIEKFDEPQYGDDDADDSYYDKVKYTGAFYFEPSSITVFDPINSDEVNKIWNKFKVFSNARHDLKPPEKYSEFKELLKKKNPITKKGQDRNINKKYASGGEGPDHKKLKEWIAENPQVIGLKNVKRYILEYVYPSGDAVDILFELSDDIDVVVEIETDNPFPGCYQAIKYRVLRCAQRNLNLDSESVRAIVVAWKIPEEVRHFCRRYDIEYFESSLE